MSKWFCSLLFFTLLISSNTYSMELSDTGEFEQKLLLLDKVSYHPSLLPLIMQNTDYLELTPDQHKRLQDWRNKNAPAMLDKMKKVAQGRIEFIDVSLNPNTSKEQLISHQQHLFRLQEEVLSYKLACRQNILDTFTPEQWETLQFILAERQLDAIH